jgi:hypothetical protein
MQPFPRPVPLSVREVCNCSRQSTPPSAGSRPPYTHSPVSPPQELVDFLVDCWDSEGLYT